MKASEIEQDFPYLAARGDNTGSFGNWLETVKAKVPASGTIADLISWGWIGPTSEFLSPIDTF